MTSSADEHLTPCPGCDRPISRHRLSCKGCAQRVPDNYRRYLWRTYRNRKTDPAARTLALAIVVTWLRAHRPSKEPVNA